jgi:hypothetical protein
VANSVQRDTALSTIQENLAPLIGDSLARSSVKLHSEKLGLTGTELNREQVDALLAQIGMAMRVFVGADKADTLTEQILANLFNEGA